MDRCVEPDEVKISENLKERTPTLLIEFLAREL